MSCNMFSNHHSSQLKSNGQIQNDIQYLHRYDALYPEKPRKRTRRMLEKKKNDEAENKVK